jgi:hypothetical protein
MLFFFCFCHCDSLGKCGLASSMTIPTARSGLGSMGYIALGRRNVTQALYLQVECSNKILDVRLLRIIAPRTSLASSFGDFAMAKNKLRELIMGSERKRGSVPDGPPLACRAHAYGMHSRFCDTVGQECGLIRMNLSHVEDEPEPQTTRVAHFFHPSHELSMAAVRIVAACGLGGWDRGEAQQGSRSLVPAPAVKTVNNTQIHVCWAPLHFLQFS